MEQVFKNKGLIRTAFGAFLLNAAFIKTPPVGNSIFSVMTGASTETKMRYCMFRYLLVCALFAFMLVGSSNIVQAAESDDAKAFVDTLGKKVIEVIDGNAPEADKQKTLRNMFAENVDTEWMGKFVLGKDFKNISEEQKQNYLEAYKNYLVEHYTSNFADYTGSKYTITDVKAEADGQYTVGMIVKSANADKQEVKAGYKVQKTQSGAFKIIDIIIEGVSLITTERSEFASVVSQSGIDGLIEKLRAKTGSSKQN